MDRTGGFLVAFFPAYMASLYSDAPSADGGIWTIWKDKKKIKGG